MDDGIGSICVAVLLMHLQTIDFDGGAMVLASGDSQGLHKVDKEQWDVLENMIRTNTGKAKL